VNARTRLLLARQREPDTRLRGAAVCLIKAVHRRAQARPEVVEQLATLATPGSVRQMFDKGGVRKVGPRCDQELNDRLAGQRFVASCLNKALVCSVDIAEIGACQSFQQERLPEDLLHDGRTCFRLQSSLTRARGLHIVEDCQREPPLPVDAAHDEACPRIVLR
jgi:hypothetical protein